jgi:hypothetical protein
MSVVQLVIPGVEVSRPKLRPAERLPAILKAVATILEHEDCIAHGGCHPAAWICVGRSWKYADEWLEVGRIYWGEMRARRQGDAAARARLDAIAGAVMKGALQ